MNIKETIEQLKDLRRSQEAFIKQRGSLPDPDNLFVRDTEAIDTAVHVLEVIERMLNTINGGN